jgi:glycosyltransferase involved in cell wall biosynthesis
LTQRDTVTSDDIFTIQSNRVQSIKNLIRKEIDKTLSTFYRKRERRLFSTGFFGYNVKNHFLYKDADIIHLHWINLGFISIKGLKKIQKPVVWTLRDMWPMTGGCHYSGECDHYKNDCGKCFQLHSNNDLDLSRVVLNYKKHNLPRGINYVAISDWVKSVAQNSSLLKNEAIRVISNNVDCSMFFPVEKNLAKKILDIKTEKKIILSGANDLNDFYKGFQKYIEALKYLDKNRYFLVFFGSFDPKIAQSLGFEFYNFNMLHDTISLRLIYSAADVFISPSIMDAFGKTIAESMACATPVVCFDATGPKDIVDHKKNGYRAKPFEPEDLAVGINWVLENRDYPTLCSESRKKVERYFDVKVIARKYDELYKEIIENENK